MISSDIQCRQATIPDLDLIAPLFDSYRQFYEMPSDTELARTFLHERLQKQESVIFIAITSTGDAVGFTQLYPSFSSVSVARIFILNDLFVVPEARRCGVASRLLEAAANYGRSVGAIRLSLSTAHDNTAAQALYRAHGWKKDEEFTEFNLLLA